MNHELVEKSFYLTSIFAEIKSKHNWTTNELKTTLILLSKISKHNIYLPDLNNTDDFLDSVKKIPRVYIVNKKEFQDITGVIPNHIAREINKVREGLGIKIINTPHPLDRNNINSGETIPWFSKISYLDKNGQMTFKFNEEAIERLAAFVKYSKIKFEYISLIKNHNALFSYIFFKILRDSSRSQSLIIEINEFKEKLSLKDKYIKIKQFKDKVLDVIESDINNHTDLNIGYKLIKNGRSFSKIEFKFDYKPEVIEKNNKSKVKNIKYSNNYEDIDVYKCESPFEAILVNWGIRAKKVVEIEEEYSLDVIQEAIDTTLEKDKAGEIETTKAAIFLGILKNKQLVSDEVFERKERELAKQEEKKIRAKISAEYDSLNSFILSNEDIIKSAFTTNSKDLPIIDKDAIPIFKKLKEIDADKFRGYNKVPILSFYHFETDSYVSNTLSDVLDRAQFIKITEYKDDMTIIQEYKNSLVKIQENKFITDEQKEQLKKEVQDSINILLGF